MKNKDQDEGSLKAVELFHKAYELVAAYRHFIDEDGLKADSISTADDLLKVPHTDKTNYIKKYPLEQRLYKGKHISDYYMVCSSSGTSGEPTFWPRDYDTDQKLEKAKQQMFEEHFNISQKKTLCLITFGLGVWTAGMLSTKLSWPSGRDNQFSVITPGLDKENAFKIIQSLSVHYDQTILLGYPPFLTDLIEYALNENYDIQQANLKLFYTSEHVSEDWRDLMANTLAADPTRSSIVGFYACSDTGIIGSENSKTIEILEQAHRNSSLSNDLFGTPITPTFVTYDPSIKYLEIVDGEVTITADQPVPLIRYNIHDRGKLLTKSQISQVLNTYDINIQLKADNYLCIYGRSDAVKVTANIYVEDIRYCLEKSSLKHKITGHFQYGTIPQEKGMRYRLKVIIYLKQQISLTAEEIQTFESEFYTNLLEANNDFKMIQSGTKIEDFKFEYVHEDESVKYKSSKLKHFL